MDFIARITALHADTRPEAIATIKYFTAVLDGKVTIPGDIAMLMAKLNCDGSVSPEIDDAHFPGADAFVSTEGVVPVEIPMETWTVSEASTYLAGLTPPMEPAMPDEGLSWAAKNPHAQWKNPLVISGQKCRFSDRRVCVIVLLLLGSGKRSVRLYDAQGWFGRNGRILAKPKKTASGV